MVKKMPAIKTYSEMMRYAIFDDRFHYLQLHGTVGMDTFGFDRYLNQDFYQSREWRQFRDKIIVRDMGCDLAHPEHEITDWVIRGGKPIRPRIIIHHLNPLTKEDVLGHTNALLDPENVSMRLSQETVCPRTSSVSMRKQRFVTLHL